MHVDVGDYLKVKQTLNVFMALDYRNACPTNFKNENLYEVFYTKIRAKPFISAQKPLRQTINILLFW